MAESKIYLSIAKDDLNASRVLLKNNCFPQALFYTEQSIEKICKYIIIKNDLAKESELKKKVGHNSMKIFDIIVDYLFSNIQSQVVIEDSRISAFYEKLNEGKEYLIKLRNDSRIKELDEDTLDKYDLQLYFYTKANLDLNSEFDFILKQSPEGFIEILKKMNLLDTETLSKIEISFQNPEEKKYYLNLLEKVVKDLPKYQNLMFSVITLATIFSTHWESTRYPKIEGNISPSDLYNEETLIIKKLDVFQEYIELNINELEKINL